MTLVVWEPYLLYHSRGIDTYITLQKARFLDCYDFDIRRDIFGDILHRLILGDICYVI